MQNVFNTAVPSIFKNILTLYVTSISNEGKMRPLQFGLHLDEISHRKPKSRKKFTLNDVLLSYQPISTADSAHLGWIGCADWLVAQKDIVESEIIC